MRPDLKRLILKRMKEDNRDYADSYNHSDNRQSDYDDYDDYEMGQDTRRGVRGSGRRRRDRMNDRYDYDDDDYEKVKLSRKIKNAWKHKLLNTDGTRGAHFSIDDLMEPIEKMRLSFDSYSESDVCLTANMLYSDFGKTLKHIIPQDKEPYYYTALAKDFLEDDDSGVEGSEKLAAYYHFIVNG